MYKVLIADDEKIIRMGLMSVIDWQAEGFEIAGQASNGSEALSFMTQQQPDLTLIDIRMPRLTGLESIKTARESGYNGRIIVLSGYSDFEYAKTAIEHGVISYLTKPVDQEALLAAIRKIRKELDEETRIKEDRGSFLDKTRKSLLRSFLIGEIDLTATEVKALSLTHSMYQVIFYEDYSKPEKKSYSLADILRVTNPDEREIEAITIDDRQAILLKGHHPIEKLKNLLTKYENELPPEKNSPLDAVFIACGSVVQHVGDIPRSYNEALLMMERRFYAARDQHFMLYDTEDYPEPDYDMIPDDDELRQEKEEFIQTYSEKLINYLQVFNRKQIAEVLHEMELYLRQRCPLPVVEQKRLLLDLYFIIKEKLLRLYSQAELPFEPNISTITLFREGNYLYELIFFFTEQFDKIMTSLGYTARDNIIDDVIAYIDHNYKTNITLETIAPLFGYNSSYLGKIFNKKLGMNFNTYLDTLRVEKAKEILISSKAPVYRVAEMVGYRNVDYFHIKFKKYTGMSPAEFRKNSGE